MNFLIRMLLVAAAGAAAVSILKRKSERVDADPADPKVVMLEDDEAVISETPANEAVPAMVRSCYRRMDPLTLTGANEAVFLLQNGEEVKLNFQGEGGLHIREGDCGLLTWEDSRLILFEKESGELIGGMYYSPAEENADE